MPDNVTFQSTTLATVPAGFVAATDDDGTAAHQYVKMEWGADGTFTKVASGASAVPVQDGGNSLTVDDGGSTLSIDDGGGSITVDGSLTLSANTLRIGVNSAGLTTASTAYTAGDQLGTILTFANAAASSGGTGLIRGAILVDKAKLVGGVDLFLFDQSVTLASDNAAFDVSDSDMDNLVGIVQFPAPTQLASNYVAFAPVLPTAYKCAATSLFGALRTVSGHSFFGAVTDLRVSLIVERD